MRTSELYVASAGGLALAATAPLASATSPAWLGVVATAWVTGVLLVPYSFVDVLAEHERTVLGIMGIACVLGVFSPPLACAVLVMALLFVRSPDFAGAIVAASLVVLGRGLALTPSYAWAAVTVGAIVCTCHLRAARTLERRSLLLAILILVPSLAAGGLAALFATGQFSLPFVALRSSARTAEPSIVPLIAALALLPVLAWALVKWVGLRSGATKKREKAVRRVGRLVGDEEIAEEARRVFSGPPANELIVREYVRWRERLAQGGVLFRVDRTAEESAEYLQSRLRAFPPASLARITELFNAARYGPAPLPPAAATEFKRLVG